VTTSGLILIAGFITVGLWLEHLNGKRCFMDEVLTPLPLGLVASVITVFEKWAY
jgi:hypothetical protein